MIRSINPFRVLSTHPNFRRFWIGQTVSLVGSWMQTMAIGWMALELSGSALVVGLVAAASALPIVLFSLHAGAYVDRNDKLRLVTIAQMLFLVEAAVLWWFTYSGHLTVGVLLSLAFFGGLVAAMEIPARQSMMIDLVGREDLRDAIALNSSGFNLARIIGPAVAATIIAHAGIAWCFAANALSFLTVLIGLRRITLPAQAPVVTTISPTQGVRDVLRHVRHDKRLLGLVELICICSILCTPVLSLLPVIAREQLALGAGGYGGLLSSIGLGGLVGALALAMTGARLKRGRLLAGMQLAVSLLIVALALTRVAWLASLVTFAIGFGFIVAGALGNTVLQGIVPDEYRGRLMAIYSIIVVGLPQIIGALAVGAFANAVGISWALASSALVMLVYVMWAFRRYPMLLEL